MTKTFLLCLKTILNDHRYKGTSSQYTADSRKIALTNRPRLRLRLSLRKLKAAMDDFDLAQFSASHKFSSWRKPKQGSEGTLLDKKSTVIGVPQWADIFENIEICGYFSPSKFPLFLLFSALTSHPKFEQESKHGSGRCRTGCFNTGWPHLPCKRVPFQKTRELPI